MNKKKTVEQLKRHRAKEKPIITPAEHKRNVTEFVEILFSVAERLPAGESGNIRVTIDELMQELKNGVKTPPVIIQTMSGERVQYNSNGTSVILSDLAQESPISDGVGETDAMPACDAFAPPKLADETTDIADIVRNKKFRSKM